jgi:hypothetical protein
MILSLLKDYPSQNQQCAGHIRSHPFGPLLHYRDSTYEPLPKEVVIAEQLLTTYTNEVKSYTYISRSL